VVGSGPAAAAITAALAAAGATVQAVSAAADFGTPDIVVHADLPSLSPQPLMATDSAGWDEVAEAPIRRALLTAQAAHRSATRLIFVVPTVSMEGAADFSAQAGASEAIRMLAKSAARRWAAGGMTVNVVSPALADLNPTLAASDAGRTKPAFAAGLGTLAQTVVWLAGPGAAGITGATIPTDGGAVLVP
jgi:3-oxoacyl-[acyl-carrier protein] reductase